MPSFSWRIAFPAKLPLKLQVGFQDLFNAEQDGSAVPDIERDGARREGLAVDRNSQFTHSLAGLHQPSFGVGLCLKTRNAQATLQNREPTVS